MSYTNYVRKKQAGRCIAPPLIVAHTVDKLEAHEHTQTHTYEQTQAYSSYQTHSQTQTPNPQCIHFSSYSTPSASASPNHFHLILQ